MEKQFLHTMSDVAGSTLSHGYAPTARMPDIQLGASLTAIFRTLGYSPPQDVAVCACNQNGRPIG